MILDKDDVMQRIASGALILDVRDPEECCEGMYPGAVNIPLGDLRERKDELKPKTRCILTYCASGHRGDMAAEILQSYGWKQAFCAGSLLDLSPSWF